MDTLSLPQAFTHNFLGRAPSWYKLTIILFLLLNPLILFWQGPVVAGWLLLIEFIFTLAMALKCYPLQPGGLLAIEAVCLNLTSPQAVYHEALNNFEVILLLMFMVTGIYFMKDLLLLIFTRVLLSVRSKKILALLFLLLAAVLSAFLDALTVMAVLMSVCMGFYQVYSKVASAQQMLGPNENEKITADVSHQQSLETFRDFLASLVMHGAIGTALGGVCTLVGEPQNLLIAQKAGWDFVTFFIKVAPISMPVLFAGVVTCLILENTRCFNYGTVLSENVRRILIEFDENARAARTNIDVAKLLVQGLAAIFLVVGLALHLAAVGLIGLCVIILLTAFTGIVEEREIGHAFQESLPFTALLVVFFVIVAVIHEQNLFKPLLDIVLAMDVTMQPQMFFIANGVLSSISDNVFVATVYINEIVTALNEGRINREQFDKLAIAINTGTNIPSVATPNGQAAFLFLLTSELALLLRLSYGRMVWMALPYTLVLTSVGLLAVIYFL